MELDLQEPKPTERRRRKSPDRVTIADVALSAGVSMKTVSRVLNHEPHVRPEIKARVSAAVAALKFRPNASARALAGSRSYLVGLYFNNPNPGYVSQIQLGAMKACRDNGYHLVVEQLSGGSEELVEQIEALHQAVRMDGVVLTPPLCDDQIVLRSLEAAGTPFVRVSPASSEEPGQAPKVFMNDWQAAYEMTVYLQGLGHREIAFIAGPVNHEAASLRRAAFIAAMADAGLEVPPHWLPIGDFSFRDGLEIGEKLISGHRRPTAIFAANDDMALGVMAVAQRWRLSVPQALSIVGFDDSPSAQVVWPRLTTVRQPVPEMAEAAVEMLIQINAGRGQDEARQLGFELMVRESAGPAPR